MNKDFYNVNHYQVDTSKDLEYVIDKIFTEESSKINKLPQLVYINISDDTDKDKLTNTILKQYSCNDTSNDNIIKLDSTTINCKEDIQKVIGNLFQPPIHDKYKILIVNKLDKTNKTNYLLQNQLLKYIEDLRQHFVCIVYTDDNSKVIESIKMRMQLAIEVN
jgi:DNA polymerase III gamma/tau subunit